MPKVSVIVPVYNGEKFIEKCITSIINQTFTDFELIIVNDGSTDDTLNTIEQINDNRIHIINKKNGGVSSARNLGYKESKGRYILFFDADDFMENTMLEILVHDMENNNVQAVRCNLQLYYPDNNITKEYNEFLFNGNYKIVDSDFLLDNAISGRVMAFSHNMLFYRPILEKLYNESIHYMEDVIYYVTMLQYVDKIYIEEKPLYNYVQNPYSVTKQQSKILTHIYGLKEYRQSIKNELNKTNLFSNDRLKLIDTRLTTLVSDLLTQLEYKNKKYKETKEDFKKIFEDVENIEFMKNSNISNLPKYKKILVELGMQKRYVTLYYYIKVRKQFSKIKKKLK